MYCPFSNKDCTKECALYIAPEDISEHVRTRLTSIGVFNGEKGMCSLKNIALSGSRYMFEKTSTFSR